MSHPELVADQNWMAYAEPRDALTTTVHVNTDFPLDAYELIEFVTHEAYPGHQAEHVLKSRLGRPELATFVYPTPQARGAREYARTWLVESDERVEKIVSSAAPSPIARRTASGGGSPSSSRRRISRPGRNLPRFALHLAQPGYQRRQTSVGYEQRRGCRRAPSSSV